MQAQELSTRCADLLKTVAEHHKQLLLISYRKDLMNMMTKYKALKYTEELAEELQEYYDRLEAKLNAADASKIDEIVDETMFLIKDQFEDYLGDYQYMIYEYDIEACCIEQHFRDENYKTDKNPKHHERSELIKAKFFSSDESVVEAWKSSPDYKQLILDIEQHHELMKAKAEQVSAEHLQRTIKFQQEYIMSLANIKSYSIFMARIQFEMVKERDLNMKPLY